MGLSDIIEIRTVDSYRYTFRQLVAIRADEGWDLSKRIDLKVFFRDALCWLGLDNLKIKLVRLRHSANRGGTRIALYTAMCQSFSSLKGQSQVSGGHKNTYRVGIELAKCHVYGV